MKKASLPLLLLSKRCWFESNRLTGSAAADGIRSCLFFQNAEKLKSAPVNRSYAPPPSAPLRSPPSVPVLTSKTEDVSQRPCAHPLRSSFPARDVAWKESLYFAPPKITSNLQSSQKPLKVGNCFQADADEAKLSVVLFMHFNLR
ncbi:hypothetical protein AMECASPLE_024818 [Ameca splendens]|uniref:Uncharacterized protein n=1 Tax=Ameca splendens TaxID=208324 RepID=A0ABV0XTJ9_9TELE